MQQIIVGIIAEHNQNNHIAFKYIFEQLLKYRHWLHPDEESFNDEIIGDLFDEMVGCALSINWNKPYKWINEYSTTHTQIGVLAYQARGIKNKS